jgi:hypothetical protein
MTHILSLSYGKDSLACLEACKLLGYPIDRVIHAEVWATRDIPADLPPMVEFKKKADAIIKERYDIIVEHIYATKSKESTEKLTYEDIFYRPMRKRKVERERIYGFPMLKGNWCTSDLKQRALQRNGASIAQGNSKSQVLRISDLSSSRELVYGSQAKSFLTAPLHKERI